MNDETYRQLVEAMAAERRLHYFKAVPVCQCGWRPTPEGHKTNELRIHVEERVLHAALSAPQSVVCETCDGYGLFPRCATCDGKGTVPGPSILVERAEVEGRYERVESGSAYRRDDGTWGTSLGAPSGPKWVPVFVLRAPQETNQVPQSTTVVRPDPSMSLPGTYGGGVPRKPRRATPEPTP